MTELRATPVLKSSDAEALELYQLVEELYPICRSITGDGVRKTLGILSRYAPLEVHEVPSGTPVLDWTVPNEWNIRDAYIADTQGRRIVDFRAHNLHVLNYSTPIERRVTREELDKHLYSLPDQANLIPYRTSYYAENWGFCLSHAQRQTLTDAEYDVCIDSTLAPGHLTYGEVVLPGETEAEILISAHVCHPSLADDNNSGLAIAALLARAFAAKQGRRHTLRFLFAPGTIGAITWLARNHARAHLIKHGLTLTCLGDHNPFTYKKTVFGDAEIDRAVAHVLAHSGYPHQIIEFFPYG
jgi:aminopeptidase-like protein